MSSGGALSLCNRLRNDTHVSKHGPLANECFINGLSDVPHVLLLFFSVPILIVWKKSFYGTIHSKSWVHFPGHGIRWFLFVVLCLVTLAEFSEGLATDMMRPDTELHLYIPHAVNFLGILMSMFYYHNAELWNSPSFLLLLDFYWPCCLITEVLKLLNILVEDLTVHHMRFVLTVISLILYVLLILVELNTWRKLVSILKKCNINVAINVTFMFELKPFNCFFN